MSERSRERGRERERERERERVVVVKVLLQRSPNNTRSQPLLLVVLMRQKNI